MFPEALSMTNSVAMQSAHLHGSTAACSNCRVPLMSHSLQVTGILSTSEAQMQSALTLQYSNIDPSLHHLQLRCRTGKSSTHVTELGPAPPLQGDGVWMPIPSAGSVGDLPCLCGGFVMAWNASHELFVLSKQIMCCVAYVPACSGGLLRSSSSFCQFMF